MITSINLTNGVVTISWNSVPGGIYRVQYINSLNGGSWTDLVPDVTATGVTATQTNAVGNATQRFYRVALSNLGLSANNKVYDGTTAATISLNDAALVGVVAGDSVSLVTNGYVATFANPNVGTNIPVSVSGLTLGGASAGNYTLTQPTGLKANITANGVSITSGLTANNKVYDGTTAATISLSNVVLAGVASGDTVNLSTNGYAASFASAGVGTGIGVSVSGLSLTGSSASNYTFIQPIGLTANITPATLTVSADNKSKAYGLPNPPLTVSYSGFANGDGINVVTGAPSLSTDATTNSPPGAYTITVSAGTLSATNYIFASVNGTLTVLGPQLSSALLSGNQVTLGWLTVAGQTNQIESTTNLITGTWTPLGAPIVGSGNPVIVTNGLDPSPERFFRLRISP